MRAIRRVTLGLGLSLVLTSASSWAQQPYPPPPAAPGTPPQGYPPPYPGAPYAPPPYGAPQYYAPPPQGFGYVPPPARIPYREGESHPGYHVEERPIKGLVISGYVVLLVPYGLSAAVGLSSTSDSDRWLLLPIAGPFADIASRSNRCSDDVACIFEPLVRITLAMDGIMQTAGGVLLLTGYLLPKKEWVSDQLYTSGSLPRVTSWSVSPRVFEGSKPGLVLSGEIF